MGEWTKEKKRAAVYVLIGVYLLYLAGQLFQGRLDDGGEVQWLLITFMVLFASVGVGLIVSSVWKIWKGGTEEEPDEHEDSEKD